MKSLCKLAFLIAVSVLCRPAEASVGTPVPLHVKTYMSPSGRYQLEVDPTERYGGGESNCKLTENGREVWSAKLPFTFFEAGVADDGTIAGYGYTHGESGFSFQSPGSGPGELRAAILDVQGKQRLDERIPRHGSSFPGGGAEPTARGMLMHSDRFTLRISGSESEEWRSYMFPTGEKLKPLWIEPPAAPPDVRLYIEDAAVIPGTPLAVVQWWRQDWDRHETGAVFAVVEHHGNSVWEHAKPKNFTLATDEESERVQETARARGCLFKASEPGQFELWFAAEGQRVLFSIAKAGEKWQVTEVSRRAHTGAVPDAPKIAPVEAPEPEKLGTFVLDAPPVEGPVRDIQAFGFDQSGRIGFLRGTSHFVLIGQSGALIAEAPLSLPEESDNHLAWIAGDRWLVTASGVGVGAAAKAWWIDVAQKSLTEIAGFECSPIEALSRSGDGGFVVLTSQHRRSSITDEMSAYGADGKRRWKIAENSSDAPGAFLSPESVTVTSRGEVAVLDNIGKTVVLFDLNGSHLRTFGLKKAWKREPNYPSEITADADGGVVVTDFGGKPPFVRMKAGGAVRSAFTPKFTDGRMTDKRAELRVAPDGRMWLNQRHALLRLNDKGVVTTIIGLKPGGAALSFISTATADLYGNIYAADDLTGAVHVFDAEGHRLRVCKPRKGDINGNLGDATLAATDQGSVLLCCKSYAPEPHCIAFGRDGKRAASAPALNIGEEWYYRNAGGGMLKLGLDSITLTDADYAKQRVIERRPDRRWLDFAAGAAVAPDGSFAVFELADEGGHSVSFYTPAGDPVRMVKIALPGSWQLAGWNGSHFVVSQDATGIVCDREGKPVRRFMVSAAEGGWTQFVTRGGRELWVLEFETRKVLRFAMPPAN